MRKKGFHSLNVKKEKIMSTFDFQATIASRGYHVNKETSWSNAKVSEKVKTKTEGNQTSIEMDPYAFAIKAKEKYFDEWKLLVTLREKFRGISTFSSKNKIEKSLAM